MARTTLLRTQHDAAEKLIGEIVEACRGGGGEFNAFQISMRLARLTGLLRIHFAQEDEVLYPLLERSSLTAVSATAREFREEMGGLSSANMQFVERWGSSRRIASDSDAFQAECSAVFAMLAKRIERENNILYPMAEDQDAEFARAS